MNLCKCINEPRGNHGLEGYQRGLTYIYEKIAKTYKIYPLHNENYSESCSTRAFHQHFMELT